MGESSGHFQGLPTESLRIEVVSYSFRNCDSLCIFLQLSLPSSRFSQFSPNWTGLNYNELYMLNFWQSHICPWVLLHQRAVKLYFFEVGTDTLNVQLSFVSILFLLQIGPSHARVEPFNSSRLPQQYWAPFRLPTINPPVEFREPPQLLRGAARVPALLPGVLVGSSLILTEHCNLEK